MCIHVVSLHEVMQSQSGVLGQMQVSKFSPWTSAAPDVPVMQYIRCCGSPGAGFQDYKTSRFRLCRSAEGRDVCIFTRAHQCMESLYALLYYSIPAFFLVLLALCNPNGNKYNLYKVGIQKNTLQVLCNKNRKCENTKL